ncbi:MAG: hypothetical protein WC538_22745 [Thermoanaerobaculia bacterium]
MFEQELSYFITHQDELCLKYAGRVLLLRGDGVEGDFESPLAAYLAGSAAFEPGTFMIQPCAPGPAAYTVTVNSSARL